jgi:hypothetical protein
MDHRPLIRQPRFALALCSTLLATLSLTACGSDSTGPRANELNVAEVEQQVSQIAPVFQNPAIASLVGNIGFELPIYNDVRSSQPRIEALLAHTRTIVAPRLVRQPSAHVQAAQVQRSAMLAASASTFELLIPTSAFGRTYVRNMYGTYVVAPSRTGAPADGIRIILYERYGDDSFGTTEVGWLDIRESVTSTTQSYTAKLSDMTGATLGEFTWTLTVSNTGTTSTGVAKGTLGTRDRQLVFADTMKLTSTQSGGTASLAMHTSAPFANVALHLNMPNLPLFDSPSAVTFTLGYDSGRNTVRIDATVNLATYETSSVVYLNGALIAKLDPRTGAFTNPSGGRLSAEVEAYLDAISTLSDHLPMGMGVLGEAESLIYDAVGTY